MFYKMMKRLQNLFRVFNSHQTIPPNNTEIDIFEIARTISAANADIPFSGWDVRELTIVTICGLEMEVNNGGFHQYYYNSTSDTAFFLMQALTNIGALRTSEITRRANFVMGEPFPLNREARQSRLMRLNQEDRAKLEELNLEFFEYHDDIGALLMSFVHAKHQEVR